MKKKFLLTTLLFIFTFLFFIKVKNYDFIQLDDALHTYQNPYFEPLSVSNTLKLWKTPYKGLYIPMTYTLWAIQSYASKLIFNETFYRPVYHLTNVFFHGLNVVMIFLILESLCFSLAAAFFAALLFAIHPVQVEAVAWISGLKDVGSTFWGLLCLFYFIRFAKTQKYFQLILCFLFYTVGIFSKPSIIVIAPIILILGFYFFRTKIKSHLLISLCLVLISLPVLYLTKDAQPDSMMRYVTPWIHRPQIIADSLLFYVSKVFLPILLTPDYSRNPQVVLGHTWGHLGWLFIIFVAVLMLYRSWRWKFLLLLFTASLFPVLGIVPFFFQFFSTVADRYLYLPFFSISLGIAFWVDSRARFAKSLITFGIIILSFLSFYQISVWKNDETLFTHTVQVNPHSLIGHNNLGTILENKGNVKEAALQYYQALEIDPQSLPAHFNLARSLALMKHFKEAIALLEGLIRIEPNLAEPHYTLGVIYLQVYEDDKAIVQLSYASQLDPDMVKAHYQLGLLFAKQKKWGMALHSIERAYQLNPDYRDIKNERDKIYLALKKQGIKSEKVVKALTKPAS